MAVNVTSIGSGYGLFHPGTLFSILVSIMEISVLIHVAKNKDISLSVKL